MKKDALFLILWALIIFSISSLPHEEKEKGLKYGMDKVIHFSIYSYLGYLSSKVFGVYGAVGAAMFAVADEMHQMVIPGREASIIDLLANLSGVGFGYLIFKRRYAISKS